MFYRIMRALVLPFFKLLYFMHYEGRTHIPAGAALICANHNGLSDPIFLAFALDTSVRIRFLAKAELFENRLFGWLFRKLGAIPIRRGETDMIAIKETLRALKNGERVVIFPEGTRNSEDGAKAGAGMLAYRAHCPAIPAYITKGRKPFRRVRVRFGAPLYPSTQLEKPGASDYAVFSNQILERVYALAD